MCRPAPDSGEPTKWCLALPASPTGGRKSFVTTAAETNQPHARNTEGMPERVAGFSVFNVAVADSNIRGHRRDKLPGTGAPIHQNSSANVTVMKGDLRSTLSSDGAVRESPHGSFFKCHQFYDAREKAHHPRRERS